MFKRKWNEELIIAHIMSRRSKEPLNALHYSSTYPDLYAAAQRVFGCWKYAIEACGIEYLKVRKYRQWTKTRVLEEIKLLVKRREPLNSIHVQVKHKPLYMAALKRFKNWADAMRAAGVDYSKVRLRRSLTKAQIKEEILKLWESGFDLAYPNMRKRRQWLLANAMKKVGGGSWDKARRLTGIKVNFRLKGDKRKVAIAKALGKDVEEPKAKKAAKKMVMKKTVKKAAPVKKIVKKAVVKAKTAPRKVMKAAPRKAVKSKTAKRK